MFKINVEKKTAKRIEETTFKDIGCKERYDFQEWVVSEPTILGEELLIIQKEFNDFDNTSDRLDLLAIDKNQNLVIIENKTDDSGKDVVWQAIRYASYCQTFTPNNIKDIFEKYVKKNKLEEKFPDCEKAIIDFLGIDSLENCKLNEGNSQRIIMVSNAFRKEVLSAVEWLLGYGLNITCIKINLCKEGENVYLDPEQILPNKENRDYTIKLANKNSELQSNKTKMLTSERLRSAFWEKYIPIFNTKSKLYENITYTNRKDHWLSTAASISTGVSYNFLICKDYCGVEFNIDTPSREKNKKIFDLLFNNKEDIEKKLTGLSVSWEKQEDNTRSRIGISNHDLSLYDEESWDEIYKYLEEAMIKLEAAIKIYIPEIKKLINNVFVKSDGVEQ